MSADNTTPPASPAATDEEVARMVERLKHELGWGIGPAMLCQEAADLLARVARERDEAQRELKLLGSACDKIRHNASVDRRELEARLAEAEKERDEAHRAYSEGVREFYARVEREITNEALRRAAEAARQWGDEQVRKWADDDKMCEDAKSRAWDVHVVARKIEALIKEPGHE